MFDFGLSGQKMVSVLSAVLLTGTLSSCIGSEINIGESTIEVNQNEPTIEYGLQAGKPYNGTQITFLICCADTPQYRAWQAKTSEFTSLTGIEVEYVWEPWGSFQEKIATEGVVGTGTYDVITWLDSWGPAFKYFMVPLDEPILQTGISTEDYPGVYIEGVSLDGEQYGLPVRGHPQMLFYRKDVFEQLGLEVPTTWNELEQAAKIITENTDLYGIASYYGTGANGQNLFVWFNYLWSNGAEIFNDDYEPVFNSPQGVEATKRYVSLLEDNLSPPGAVTYNEAEASRSVAQGESAMIITWWWRYALLTDETQADALVADNIGFAVPPAWEGKQSASYAIQLPVGVSAFSQNKQAAWEFLKWLTSVEVEREIVLDKTDPGTSTIVAVNQQNLEDSQVNQTSNGLHQTAARVLQDARTTPLIPEWAEVASVLEIAINQIASGEEVEPTLDRAAVEIEEIMDRAGYYE